MAPATIERYAEVCVIGAGVSGLVTSKYLHQAGIPFDCFDERKSIGGIWAYTEESGITCAWHSLNQNSPRGTYAFSDFPMPDDYAGFPSAAETSDYLNRYVDHFGFRHHIRMETRVEQVDPVSDGTWDVTLSTGERRNYRAVVVANGHHNEPIIPDYDGEFSGEVMHSQDYRYRSRFKGKRVLVVGFGNSGSQIAADLSHDTECTFLSTRRGAWVIPNYIRGVPYDRWMPPTPWWLYRVIPPRLLGGIFSGYARLVLGRQDLHGLPKPEHSLIGAFPTVCEGLHARIANGRIAIKPAVKRFDGNRVTFTDGSEETIDAIVYCTGYRTSFPFLSPEVFTVEDNRVRLYKRTFLPSRPGLCFIGAMQVLAPAFAPIFEVQARLVTAYLNGTYSLPSAREMEHDIERELADISRFFVHSPRHNYQAIDTLLLHGWKSEIKRGRKRARVTSNPLTEGARQHSPQAELSAAGK